MKLLSRLLLFLLLCPIGCFARDRMEEARIWCDTTTLDALEGIWLLPDDGVYLLVKRMGASPLTDYSLEVVATLDGRTETGSMVGTMSPAPDRKSVQMRLPVRRRGKGAPVLQECKLEVAEGEDALMIVPQKSGVRFTFSPTSLLSGFWKLVRISYSPKEKEKSTGLVKVYPTYDGNGSDRHNPRYL